MGLFDNWFGRSNKEENTPNIDFGRYSDAYKADEQNNAWKTSLQQFDEGNHFDAYESFFDFLSDDEIENVSYTRIGDRFEFELYQGSKKIIGYSDRRKFKAEAKVVKVDSPNVGFMRRLVEKNFSLKYSRFALDGLGNVVILFDTYLLDASPHKLYHALNELSTNADKMDDLLVDEFDVLKPIETGHITDLPDEEKKVKFEFITKKIKSVLESIEYGKLAPDVYPQATGYLLLDLVYKLDYLTKPEGFMMEALERLNRSYFVEDGKTAVQKNEDLVKELQQLAERPGEEFFKEFYGVKCTFGLTQVVNHDRLAGFISEVIKYYDWYEQNGHSGISLAVSGYIAGYCLFHWSLPLPDKQYLHLLYEIIEWEYFEKLGFEYKYVEKEGHELNRYAIKKRVIAIARENSGRYPSASPDPGMLDYSSMPAFARSFLLMVQELDMTPARRDF